MQLPEALESIAALEKQLGEAREAIEKEPHEVSCAPLAKRMSVSRWPHYPTIEIIRENQKILEREAAESKACHACNCWKSRALAALSATPPAQREVV